MATGVAALHEAIVTAWNLSETLRSGRADPEMTLPYVIFQVNATNEVGRQSGFKEEKQLDIDVPVEFRCYAVSTATLTAKEYAADMANRIKKVYGGHPTVRPTSLPLDFGKCLQSRLTTEDDETLGEDEHLWRVGYTFKLDMPVKT